MRRLISLACVPLVAAALVPAAAAAKGGHVTLLNTPPARIALGGTWIGRVRVTDHFGAPAWGAPAELVLVERRRHTRAAFEGPLSDRRGRSRIRVRFNQRGRWAITALARPVRSTVVARRPRRDRDSRRGARRGALAGWWPRRAQHLRSSGVVTCTDDGRDDWRETRMRRGIACMSGALVTATVGAGVCVWAAPALSAATSVVLVSRAGGSDGRAANGASLNASISRDGRLVVFGSDAGNLVPGRALKPSVYVRDVRRGRTRLVSDFARRAIVTTDGVTIAFEIGGGDLSAPDVGVYRVGARRPRALYQLVDGLAPASETANRRLLTSVSDDGRLVAFSSPDSGSPADVWVADLRTRRVTAITRALGTQGVAAAGDSSDGRLSGDGTAIAFTSVADNLAPDDDNAVVDVFVRNLATGATTLVNRASGAGADAGDRDAAIESISRDGRYVTFSSEAGNLATGATAGVRNVFRRDLQTNTTTLISRGGDGPSSASSMSADGRFVAFQSSATNLAGVDRCAGTDIFVRDTATATTRRITGLRPAGAHCASTAPALSADGSWIAFATRATVAGAPPTARRHQQIYRARLPSGSGETKHGGEPLSPAALRAILVDLAAHNGEPHPHGMQMVFTNGASAHATLYPGDKLPAGPYGPASGDAFVLTAMGNFTAYSAKVPPGFPFPTGSVVSMIVDAYTGGISSWGLSDAQPKLASLGTVIALP